MIKYVKIKRTRQIETEAVLLEKEHFVVILWSEAFEEKRSQKVNVTCTQCGTVEIKSVSNLKMGRYRCGGCVLDKYTKLADKLGFDFIGKTSRGFRTQPVVKCRKDQFELPTTSSELIRGWLLCPLCQENSYREALAKKGCVLVSTENKIHGASKRKRVVYRNILGDVFEATSGAILNGDFASVKDSQWYARHSTYLIIINYQDSVYCKIGTAVCPTKRLTQLKLLGEPKVYTLDTFADRFGADKLESKLHKEFENLKLDRTIADSFTTAVVKVRRKGQIERALIKDGTTEWFTHEVYDILKTRYNLEKEENGSNSDTIREVTCTG